MMTEIGNYLSGDNILIYGSALAAALTVVLVGLPMLKRQEGRERMEAVINHRQQLVAEARANMSKTRPQDMLEKGAAAESVSRFFRLKSLVGDTNVREKLVAAGYRKPQHVMVYHIGRVVLPVFLTGLALMLLSMPKNEIPNGLAVPIALAAAMLGYALPGILVKNAGLKRREEISVGFPDALDLMLVCVEGGLGMEQAVQTVTRDIASASKILAEEFGLMGAELAFLGDRKQALRNFSTRIDHPGARSFASALIQAEKYGTPLGQALRVLSAEMRDKRMAEAEKKAASLPPKLTVPMIAFFMPTLFIVILGPAIIQGIRTASGM
jgi:tight adherence protein C